jgi:hypothetical protein
MYSCFREPTKWMIKKWNEIALRAETEHAVAEGVQLINKEQFDRIIFGERIADFNRISKPTWTESGEAGALPECKHG